MATHDRCKWNCGGTDCHAPVRVDNEMTDERKQLGEAYSEVVLRWLETEKELRECKKGKVTMDAEMKVLLAINGILLIAAVALLAASFF